MEKSIAVIMSCYKNDTYNYVFPSIESLLNQTYSNFDVFIKIDGPIDKTVEKYLVQLKDFRFHLSKRNENMGLAYSLNELLDIVKKREYEYIARMDADDICELYRFEKLLMRLTTVETIKERWYNILARQKNVGHFLLNVTLLLILLSCFVEVSLIKQDGHTLQTL